MNDTVTKQIFEDRIEYRDSNGWLHREDGPAIEHIHGIILSTLLKSKEWYCHGKRHRADGPAVEWLDGTKTWFFNGDSHRIGGPAVEGEDGACMVWAINNVRHSKQTYWLAVWSAYSTSASAWLATYHNFDPKRS